MMPVPLPAVVMLVEDQLLIALNAETVLLDAGVGRVIAHATAEDALNALAAETPTLAILDIKLGQGTSFSVAAELQKRGVPFAFATGYSDNVMIPAEYAQAPIVRKPYTSDELLAAIAKCLT